MQGKMKTMDCIMSVKYWIIFVFCFTHDITGQPLPGETLYSKSFCDLGNVTLTCDSGRVLAFESVQFGYNVNCGTVCCKYDTNDHLVSLTNTADLKRQCSGKPTCSPMLPTNHDFSNTGYNRASYVHIKYYCIPESRIAKVCSPGNISSTGEPVYLTNDEYPDVTIGSKSCTCSFEAESCSSSSSIFIFDADFYSNTTNCHQNLQFTDANNLQQGTIRCESYYDRFITKNTTRTNYFEVIFNSTTTQNLEGNFFVGFAASEPNVSLKLHCPSNLPTFCIDCGQPESISNGTLVLHDSTNTGYNATVNVSCSQGFKANTTIIRCTERGKWERARCVPIDCGHLPNVPHGSVKLDDASNSTYGATATVTCDVEYIANKTTIVCLHTGLWETVECISTSCSAIQWKCTSGACIENSTKCNYFPDCVDQSDEFNCTGTEICPEGLIACQFLNGSHICVSSGSGCDCGPLPTIYNGTYTLTQPGNATYGATATVSCVTGYNPSLSTITCLANATWKTATCNVIDCGVLPSISFGNYILNSNGNTTYGAIANVICASGYQYSSPIISCLADSKWESATCKTKGTTDDNASTIIGAVVGAVLGVILIQQIISSCLHVKIYRKYKERKVKVGVYMACSAVPLIGLGVIVYRWRFLKHELYHEKLESVPTCEKSDGHPTTDTVYRIQMPHNLPNQMLSNDMTHSINGYDFSKVSESAKNSNHEAGDKNRSTVHVDSHDHEDIELIEHSSHSNPDNREDQAPNKESGHVQNHSSGEATRFYENTAIKAPTQHPEHQNNHSGITRGISAACTSSDNLTDIGQPHHHLHPQNKTKFPYGDSTLHERSHLHGNEILKDRGYHNQAMFY